MLTDADRVVLARARQLTEVSAARAAAVREYAGEDDLTAAYAVAFAEARHLLTQLADLLEQHAGS